MGENDSIADAMGIGPTMIITSGGVDYELAPLRMEDMAAVEKFAKAQHRADILSLLREAGDLITPEERVGLIRELSGQVSGGVTEKKVEAGWTWMDEMSSPAVITFVIVMRLRKANPEMTEEQAKDIITVDAIANVEEEMSTLLGLDAFGTAEGGEAEPGEAPSA